MKRALTAAGLAIAGGVVAVAAGFALAAAVAEAPLNPHGAIASAVFAVWVPLALYPVALRIVPRERR